MPSLAEQIARIPDDVSKRLDRFAFGFGIDRMAKERHAVGDVREMYVNDMRFVEQF